MQSDSPIFDETDCRNSIGFYSEIHEQSKEKKCKTVASANVWVELHALFTRLD
jgi:hypothetical protein